MSEVEKRLRMEEERRRNRERFPEMTKWIDEMRSVFGDVKVMWVREGDNEAGAPSTDNWVQLTPGDGYVGDRSRGKKADGTARKKSGFR
jgi:hypothetical protein